MRVNLDDVIVRGFTLESGLKLKSAVIAAVDQQQLDLNMPPLLFLNPAGAVSVRMPASTVANAGSMFYLVNVSAAAVTVVNSAGTGFTTAIVLAAGESTIVVSTGSPNALLGWRALGTATSA